MKMKNFLNIIFFAVFLFAFNQPSTAQMSGEQPRLAPDPMAYTLAERFDQDGWRSLTELAYWCSGDAGWEAAVDMLAPVLKEFTDSVESLDEREKGEAALRFMHEEFLSSYYIHQSSLKELLSSGRFNCLSSAVLYTIIGTAAGLEVTGVNTFDHAFCSVKLDTENIDVETTNPYGFDPGEKTEFQDDFGSTTGFTYVPPANYRDRSSIDVLNLFSLLLQNRIAEAEASRLYTSAVGIAVDRWALLGGGKGSEYEDLITRMLNYGTLLSRAGRETDALAWTERAINVYGPHPKWDDFLDGVVNNVLVKLIMDKRFEEARARLEVLKPRLTAKSINSLELMVSDAELVTALDIVIAGGTDSDFLEVLTRTRMAGLVADDRLQEVELNWRLYKIKLVAEAEGWAAAYDYTEDAIFAMGNLPQLQRARSIYYSNIKAEMYNKAVEAFNDGRYADAKILAERGILKFPDEMIFMSLLETLERIIDKN